MGVLDGQSVNAAVTNPAFINKNTDDVMPNKLGLSRALSGTSIADIQATLNKLYTATGASETQTGTVYDATANTIDNGDSYETALAKLANKFDAATGHTHTGNPGDGPLIAAVLSLAVTGNTPLSGNLVFVAATGMSIAQVGDSFVFSAPFNTQTTIAASGSPPLTGDVLLVPGSGIVLTQVGQQIQIESDVAASQTPRNLLLNGDFYIWQAGISIVVENASRVYQADQWYTSNFLGTDGEITYSQIAGSLDGSIFAAQLEITTAPTSGETNGTELWQVLENADAIQLYNQFASFGIQVKALGSVNQIGVQFFYATSLSDWQSGTITPIGSEVLTSVNSGGFTRCQIDGQAIGTAMTLSGLIGVRTRITGVSSGNPYDVNNGFIAEQGIVNLGAVAANFARAYPTLEAELAACQRFYEKSYDLTIPPGSLNNETWVALNYKQTITNGEYYGVVKLIPKLFPPVITIYSFNGTLNQISDGAGTDLGSGSADVPSSTIETTLFPVRNFSGGSISDVSNQGIFLGNWVADSRI